MLVLLTLVSGAREGKAASEPTPLEPGALAGRVRLTGDALPGPTPVENTTDPDNCGHAHTLEDLLVSATSRGVRNVILSLSGVEAGEKAEPTRLVLDNVGCRFVPHAAVLTVGSTIEAVNSDSFLHTVHLYGPAEMNVALPGQGSRGTRVARRPGMIVVKCDVHAWMTAFIRVDPHPFHAVSDAEGRFRIPDVPPGSYVLEGWHDQAGGATHFGRGGRGLGTFCRLRRFLGKEPAEAPRPSIRR